MISHAKISRNRSGSQQYQCRTCGTSKVLLPKQRYSEERKAEVLRVYQDRSSLQGLSPPSGSRAKRSRAKRSRSG